MGAHESRSFEKKTISGWRRTYPPGSKGDTWIYGDTSGNEVDGRGVVLHDVLETLAEVVGTHLRHGRDARELMRVLEVVLVEPHHVLPRHAVPLGLRVHRPHRHLVRLRVEHLRKRDRLAVVEL